MNSVQRAVVLLAFLTLPLAPFAAASVYELKVDGLACPFCAYGIEKKLGAIAGVETVDVDLKEGRVIVTMAEGTVLTEEIARRAVTDAGFTLKAFAQVPGGKQ